MPDRRNSRTLLLAVLAVILLLAAFFLGRASTLRTLRVETARAGGTQLAQLPVLPVQTAQSGAQTRLCLNTATRAQLLTLPGVGETLADRILAYRAQYGRFSASRQLLDVEGIGESLYAALEPLVTVEE